MHPQLVVLTTFPQLIAIPPRPRGRAGMVRLLEALSLEPSGVSADLSIDEPTGEDAVSRKLLVAVLVVIAFVIPLGSALADDDDDQGEHHGWGHHHGWEDHGWGHGWGWGHHDWGHLGWHVIYGAPVYVVPYSYYAPYAYYNYYEPYGYSYGSYHHSYYAHRHYHRRHVCCCCY